MFKHHERCSSCKLPGSNGQFIFGSTCDLFVQQETKKKGQHGFNENEKTPLKLMAGNMSFLKPGLSQSFWILTEISNINSFFIKKKKNVVVFSNIHNKFSS